MSIDEFLEIKISPDLNALLSDHYCIYSSKLYFSLSLPLSAANINSGVNLDMVE